VHPDNFAGMEDIDVEAVYPVLGQFVLKPGSIPHKGYRYAEFPAGGNGSRNFHGRGIISPHCVNGNSHHSR
jgi:hypothetical protein